MWKNIIKTENERRMNERRKPQTKESGGERPTSQQSAWQQRYSNRDEETLDTDGDTQIADLAEMTREDLQDAVMAKIGQMSEKELINILELTEGNYSDVNV
tara:strand:- start:2267 stop:2569 length:303 start_codon:yes stop_codon:yes gene_type:complete